MHMIPSMLSMRRLCDAKHAQQCSCTRQDFALTPSSTMPCCMKSICTGQNGCRYPITSLGSGSLRESLASRLHAMHGGSAATKQLRSSPLQSLHGSGVLLDVFPMTRTAGRADVSMTCHQHAVTFTCDPSPLAAQLTVSSHKPVCAKPVQALKGSFPCPGQPNSSKTHPALG